MYSMVSQLLNMITISLPSPDLQCEDYDCEEEDCSSSTSILVRLYLMLHYVVSLIAGTSTIWLVPLLVMIWRYRWVILHYIKGYDLQ